MFLDNHPKLSRSFDTLVMSRLASWNLADSLGSHSRKRTNCQWNPNLTAAHVVYFLSYPKYYVLRMIGTLIVELWESEMLEESILFQLQDHPSWSPWIFSLVRGQEICGFWSCWIKSILVTQWSFRELKLEWEHRMLFLLKHTFGCGSKMIQPMMWQAVDDSEPQNSEVFT